MLYNILFAMLQRITALRGSGGGWCGKVEGRWWKGGREMVGRLMEADWENGGDIVALSEAPSW